MSISKTDFMAQATDAASNYPNVRQFLEARDPRMLAQMEAFATMMAMLSSQIDVAKFEPFLKSRDGTVLADASLKGVLPLGRACRVTLTLVNTGGVAVPLPAGRRLLDAKGRIYELDEAVTIPSVVGGVNGTASAKASQLRRRAVTSQVTEPADFYRLQVPLSDDDLFLNTLVVTKGTQEFIYAPDWFNVGIDQFAFQVEVDELRRMFICFGKSSVIGYGVKQGDEFTLDITECNGRINDLTPGGQFTLEYVYEAHETALRVLLDSVQDEGAAPASGTELRYMARYPAIYDHNAVYLGEFGFMLRRYITGIRFLSVWNEQIEENARGANVDNINCLFVSGLVSGMDNTTFQDRVTSLIARADNSYTVKYVAANQYPVPMTITASIAISWDLATVEAQIRALILQHYGDGSIEVSDGQSQPIKKAQINKLLRENIDALRDDKAEYDVDFTLPSTALPEHFLFVSAASLTVNVSSVEYGVSLWNH